MDRRDFLLLRIAGPHDAELSCERLYMRWVDAAASGTKRELFDSLRADLLKTKAVRLNGREWLARQMDRTGLSYQRQDNYFAWLEDPLKAQRFPLAQLATTLPSHLLPAQQ